MQNFAGANRAGKVFLGCLPLFGLCIVCSVLQGIGQSAGLLPASPTATTVPAVAAVAPSDVNTLTTAPSALAEPTAQTIPTVTAEPTAIPATPTPVDPKAVMTSAVVEAYGKPQSERPELVIDEPNPGMVIITFPVKDNFTTNFIRKGMLMDIAKMAQAAYGSGYPIQRLSFVGTFPLKDQFGNTQEGPVARVTLPKATYDKINWAGFDVDNLMTVGEDPYLHRDFNQ